MGHRRSGAVGGDGLVRSLDGVDRVIAALVFCGCAIVSAACAGAAAASPHAGSPDAALVFAAVLFGLASIAAGVWL